MFGRRIRLTPGTVLAAVALFVALGGAAYAAGGNPFVGPGFVIHGCVTKGGTFKVVKPSKSCPKHSTALPISQVGLPGAAGKTGAAGRAGAAGAAGAAGHNGAVGATGPAGAAGATGPTGNAIGYSATTGATGVDISGATGQTGKTIVSKSLPAGNYILSGKVEIDMSDTAAGGRAWVECALGDTPSGGGSIVTDISNVSRVVDYPVTNPVQGIAFSTLPFTLATNTGDHPSTAAISCVIQDANAGLGSLKVSASNPTITAIQTATNG
jgi:hypothetical protein